MKKLRIVIVGAGDVAQRLFREPTAARVQHCAMVRSEVAKTALHSLKILAVNGDLDARRSLTRAAALCRAAAAVIYLAPPPNLGRDDPRMSRWLAATAASGTKALRGSKLFAEKRARRTPRPSRALTNVYVSTTGVYGDRAGDWVDETTTLRAQSARAKRRVAAEARVRSARRERMCVLRAPGIYAQDRLPIERLRERLPALINSEDVYSNHIHANDLARLCWFALFRAKPARVYNAVDDGASKMGDYFDGVAAALSLPRPPRMPRAELAKHVTPMMLSFMSESRRIRNARIKNELRFKLQYATPQAMLSTMQPAEALQRSLIE